MTSYAYKAYLGTSWETQICILLKGDSYLTEIFLCTIQQETVLSNKKEAFKSWRLFLVSKLECNSENIPGDSFILTH